MEKLKIDFDIPDYLEEDIDNYVNAINEHDSLWDCYWFEVFNDLRYLHNEKIITEEQFETLKDYYL